MSDNKAEILSPEEAQRVIESEGYDNTGNGSLSDLIDDEPQDPQPEPEEVITDPEPDPAPEESQDEPETEESPKPEEVPEEVVDENPPSIEEDPKIEEDVAVLTGGMFADSDELIDFATKIQEDPFMKDLIDYYRQEGTVTPYLDAMKVNYDDISDEDLLRRDFDERFKDSGLTKEELDSAFERKVLAKYNLDNPEEYDELDVKLGRAELKSEAAKLRNQLKEEQKKFAAPSVPREEPVDKEQIRRDEIRLEAKARKFVNQSLNDGKLSFNIGENSYELGDINQQDMVNMITNTERIVEHALTDKKIDLRKLAFLSNPNEFLARVENDAYAKAQADFVDGNLKNKKPAKDQGAPPPREINPKERDVNSYVEQFRGAQIVKR